MAKLKKNVFSYKTQRRIVIGISLLILLFFYTFKNYSIPLRALSAISFIVVFYMIDHYFDVRFKYIHYIIAIAIAFFGFILSEFYFIYPQYDKILHFLMPILSGILIFHIVDKVKIELKWKLLFTFFVLIAINGLFEIGEYLLDLTFDFKLQGVYLRDFKGIEKFDILQDRLDDTMIDMSIGLVGSIVFIVFSWLKLRFYTVN